MCHILFYTNWFLSVFQKYKWLCQDNLEFNNNKKNLALHYNIMPSRFELASFNQEY